MGDFYQSNFLKQNIYFYICKPFFKCYMTHSTFSVNVVFSCTGRNTADHKGMTKRLSLAMVNDFSTGLRPYCQNYYKKEKEIQHATIKSAFVPYS